MIIVPALRINQQPEKRIVIREVVEGMNDDREIRRASAYVAKERGKWKVKTHN